MEEKPAATQATSQGKLARINETRFLPYKQYHHKNLLKAQAH
jgi:hypothetical protein